MKAHPTTPHRPRPYGLTSTVSQNLPLRTSLSPLREGLFTTGMKSHGEQALEITVPDVYANKLSNMSITV